MHVAMFKGGFRGGRTGRVPPPPIKIFQIWFFLIQLCIRGLNISNTIIIVCIFHIRYISNTIIIAILDICIFIQYYPTPPPPPHPPPSDPSPTPTPAFQMSNFPIRFKICSCPFAPPLTSNPGFAPDVWPIWNSQVLPAIRNVITKSKEANELWNVNKLFYNLT